MTKLWYIAALAATAAAVPAAAQEQEQPQGSVTEASQINEIGSTARSVSIDATEAPQLSEDRAATNAPQQLSDVNQSNRPVSQLSRNGDRRATPQLNRDGPTAEPTEALSAPEDGRTGAIARVEGDDRCDPGERGGRNRPAACARVIETRSSEFARTEPTPLSPEQRLLIEQRNRMTMGSQASARRLATNAGDPDEIQDQAIASVALRGAVPVTRNEDEEQPAELSAEVAALVQAIGNQVANPQ